MAKGNPYDDTSRFGALRSMGYSSGYDTVGKENYSHKVVFTIDYSSMELGLKEAKALLGDFGRDIKTSMKGVKSSYGTIMVDSDFSNIYETNALIELPSGPGIAEDVGSLADQFTAETKATIKRYIGGRVDTGRMKASVYGRTIKRKGVTTSQAGWLDLWFKYFGYQEDGTRKVNPMHSMLRSYLEVAPWVQKSMSQYLRNFTKGKGYNG